MKPKLVPQTDTLLLVEPHEATTVWPSIEEYVRQANSFGGGKFAPHHWLAKILNGQAELLVSPTLKTAVVCEPQQFPLRRVYMIVLLGGEGGCNWDNYMQVFEERSRVFGCTALEVYGRAGWKKIVESRGAKLAHCVWRKELE